MSTWPLLPKRESDYPFFADDAFEIAVEELAQSQNTVMVWLNDPAHNPTGLTMTAEGRRVALDIMMASASKHPNVGHTLLLDTAYSLYATEPHGWGQTIVDAMEDGTPWPENFLITYALSLSKSHTAYGLRTGALIGIHPDEDVIERLRDIFERPGAKLGRQPLEFFNIRHRNCTQTKNLQRNGPLNEIVCKAYSQSVEICSSKHVKNMVYQLIQLTMGSLRGLNMKNLKRSQKLVPNIMSTSCLYEEVSESVCVRCQLMRSNESQRRLQPYSTR